MGITHGRRRASCGPALALVGLLLSACAAQPPRIDVPTLIHHGPQATPAPVSPRELTPEMMAFLKRYVLPYHDPDTRLRLLSKALTSSAMLGFRYDEKQTLTAKEAFRRRTGNCVAFSNLAVAMARASGLDAWYQEVSLEPVWTSVDDSLLVPRHINVVIAAGTRRYELDYSGIDVKDRFARRRLDDNEALGLHYNNLGAEALFDRDLSRAYAHLKQAVAAAPEHPDPWINLGVTFGRNGQLDEAMVVYQHALDLKPSAVSALSNLYSILVLREDLAAAEAVARRVDRHRRQNPYHLWHMAEEALEEGQYAEAQLLLEEALERKDDEHRFFFTLARVHLHNGNESQGEANLLRAQQLAPTEYLGPMTELKALAMEP